MRRRQTRISRVDIISHESHVAESIHLRRQKTEIQSRYLGISIFVYCSNPYAATWSYTLIIQRFS
ncbi:hypothetical protein K456DRAFT_623404 [Colletotrichum gloeosporioides 23]|nr:hypothetical protein K456DRAFT_623404 [Colletotrichum gloeosporioides 23]